MELSFLLSSQQFICGSCPFQYKILQRIKSHELWMWGDSIKIISYWQIKRNFLNLQEGG